MKRKKEKTIVTSRRQFIKTLPLAASALLFTSNCQKNNMNNDDSDPQPTAALGPRPGITNPFMNSSGQPILVCVEGSDFVQMVLAGFESLGGLERLINNNQDVLIKPNLFEKSQYPWISSLDSICSLTSIIKEVTSGKVKAGDMSFEEVNSVYNYLGIEAAITNVGGSLTMFSEIQKVRQSSWDPSKPNFNMFTEVYNAPVLINFPVLKPHYLASMTCAIKNNFGTVSGSHATGTRGVIHERLNLREELAEVAALANPDFTIVDARSIVTRIGPFFEQKGPVVQTNKVIMCGDMVATDAYCANLLAENDDYFDISAISSTLQRAVLLGLGRSDLSQVEIREISI